MYHWADELMLSKWLIRFYKIVSINVSFNLLENQCDLIEKDRT